MYYEPQPFTNWESGWYRELVGPALHVVATSDWHRRYPQMAHMRADELMAILNGQQCPNVATTTGGDTVSGPGCATIGWYLNRISFDF